MVSVPDYEGAVISFDAVEDATKYVVAYQSHGSSDWDEVGILPCHTISPCHTTHSPCHTTH